MDLALKDSNNSSALLQPKLQSFSKPVSSSEQEKVGKGIVTDNTDTSTYIVGSKEFQQVGL